jgi:serine O-acetyltransferase
MPRRVALHLMHPLRLYRLARWLYLRRIPALPALLHRLGVLLCGCSIPPSVDIGAGFEAAHFGVGIMIHPHVRIGNDVCVSGGVVIGGSRQKPGVPRIGDNVYIAAGAKILGDVEIGDECVIGANTVVTRSLPPRTVASTAAPRITSMPARVCVHGLTGWPHARSTPGSRGGPRGRSAVPPVDRADRLARCFAAVFPQLAPGAIPRASQGTVAEWDSIAAISLLAVTEEEFGVQFAPEAIDELTSFAAILDCLERRAVGLGPSTTSGGGPVGCFPRGRNGRPGATSRG